MTFDLNSAVQQGRTGQVPPGWELFPIKTGKAIGGGIAGAMLGLFFIGAAVYLFLSGTIIIPAFLPDSMFGGTSGAVLGLAEPIIVVAIAIVFIVGGVRSIVRARSTDHFLLLTPEGFAEARGQKVRGAAYAEVTNIRAVTNGTELAVSLRGRPAVTVGLASYGKPRELQALILGGARAAQQQGA